MFRPVKHLKLINVTQHKHIFSKEINEILTKIFNCLNLVGHDGANYNNSDAMTDYFDVGWIVYVKVGKYDKPFVLTA